MPTIYFCGIQALKNTGKQVSLDATLSKSIVCHMDIHCFILLLTCKLFCFNFVIHFTLQIYHKPFPAIHFDFSHYYHTITHRDLKTFHSNAHSYYEYLCQVSLKFLH